MIFDLAEFWAGLAVVNAQFTLPDRRSMERDGRGPITPVQIGQRVWMGSVSISRYSHAEGRAVHAKIEAMKEGDSVFFLSPSDRQKEGETGTIAQIEEDRRLVGLSGVSVQVGDYIGFKNGTNYALHKVVRAFTGDDGLVSPFITVVPPLPLSISVGDVATTDTPLVKARIDIDTRGPAFSAARSDRFSFSFYQILT